MTRIAMLHTGHVVIPTFIELAHRHLDVKVTHLLDNQIVGDVGAADNTITQSLQRRLDLLGTAAVEGGASAILITCSSISAAAAPLERAVGVPVYRVDEAMADRAVATGPRIGVVATLPTTLEPTCSLIAERARHAGTEVHIEQMLCHEAFDLISAGDTQGHDREIRTAVESLESSVDVIVLAQASMARAVESLGVAVPVLSSPELGVLRVKDELDRLNGSST